LWNITILLLLGIEFSILGRRDEMTPVLLEVIAPTLSGLGLSCGGCNVILRQLGMEQTSRDACSNEFPEEWKKEWIRLSEWIERISALYKHRVHVRLIDAQSPLGIWKQLRHRVFGVPIFIVDHKRARSGWHTEEVESFIDERIREACNRMEAEARAKSGMCDEQGLQT
jgi:hypothetical protein